MPFYPGRVEEGPVVVGRQEQKIEAGMISIVTATNDSIDGIMGNNYDDGNSINSIHNHDNNISNGNADNGNSKND